MQPDLHKKANRQNKQKYIEKEKQQNRRNIAVKCILKAEISDVIDLFYL